MLPTAVLKKIMAAPVTSAQAKVLDGMSQEEQQVDYFIGSGSFIFTFIFIFFISFIIAIFIFFSFIITLFFFIFFFFVCVHCVKNNNNKH